MEEDPFRFPVVDTVHHPAQKDHGQIQSYNQVAGNDIRACNYDHLTTVILSKRIY